MRHRGWNLDPDYATWHLDDIAVACELEAQGHDVWFAEFYERRNQSILWEKTSKEPGVSDDFDEVYIHPKMPSLVEFMANPGINQQPKRVRHYDLVLRELDRFEGPIRCVTNDERAPYLKMWGKDHTSVIERCLGRDTFIHDPGVTRTFPGLLKRVEKRLLTDKELKWAAKWCVENLLGRTYEKHYDFIIDGYNKWKDYAPERRAVIEEVLEAHPTSATLGRLSIPGLPNVSNGKMIRGASRCAEACGAARYKLLSWEPFHFQNEFFWITRTTTAMASDSLVFTTSEGAPSIFPRFDLNDLPEASPDLLERQHSILRDFAHSTSWPKSLIPKRV